MVEREPATSGGPQRIVVGVDGSLGSDAALVWAAEEARRWDAALLVVHAWDMPPLVASSPFTASAIAAGALEEDAKTVTARAVDRARSIAPGVRVTKTIIASSPGEVLRDLCQPGDLVVVGRRGRSAASAVLLGSVSQHCIQHLPVPVAVIPRPPVHVNGDAAASVAAPSEPFVLVGIDGSETAGEALRWAAVEAARRNIALRVLHAWHQPVLATPGGRGIVLPDPDLHDEAEAVVRDAVAGLSAFALDGSPVESAVVQADAGRALIEASPRAAILVIGSRGRGALAGLLLGSVSQECARRAACPVVVIPARGIDPG